MEQLDLERWPAHRHGHSHVPDRPNVAAALDPELARRAFGERWTGQALRELESQGWRIFDDLTASHGNIDHVVVGPSGVFLLDSKRWRGSVTVDGDSAVVRRMEDPDLPGQYRSPAHVKGLAREVSEAVRASTRARVWVTPVIVVWADFPQGVAGDTVIFVHGDALARWLGDQPARIAPGRVAQIAEAVARALAGPDETRWWARSVRLQRILASAGTLDQGQPSPGRPEAATLDDKDDPTPIGDGKMAWDGHGPTAG